MLKRFFSYLFLVHDVSLKGPETEKVFLVAFYFLGLTLLVV